MNLHITSAKSTSALSLMLLAVTRFIPALSKVYLLASTLSILLIVASKGLQKVGMALMGAFL